MVKLVYRDAYLHIVCYTVKIRPEAILGKLLYRDAKLYIVRYTVTLGFKAILGKLLYRDAKIMLQSHFREIVIPLH